MSVSLELTLFLERIERRPVLWIAACTLLAVCLYTALSCAGTAYGLAASVPVPGLNAFLAAEREADRAERDRDATDAQDSEHVETGERCQLLFRFGTRRFRGGHFKAIERALNERFGGYFRQTGRGGWRAGGRIDGEATQEPSVEYRVSYPPKDEPHWPALRAEIATLIYDTGEQWVHVERRGPNGTVTARHFNAVAHAHNGYRGAVYKVTGNGEALAYDTLEAAKFEADARDGDVYGPRGTLLYDAAALVFVAVAVAAMAGAILAGIFDAAATAGTLAGGTLPVYGIAPRSGTVRTAFRKVCARLGFDVSRRERAVQNVYALPFDDATFTALGEWYKATLDAPPQTTDRDARAYAALRRESLLQLRELQSAGLDTWISASDPYDNAGEVTDAVRNRAELSIRGTRQHDDLSAEHPMNRVARDARTGRRVEDTFRNVWTFNDAFRAVHDALTHAHIGADSAPFNPQGEYRANCAHALAFSRDAVAALLCEAAGLVAYMHVQGDLTAFPDSQPARAVPVRIVDAFLDAALQDPPEETRERLAAGSSPDVGGDPYAVDEDGELTTA